MLFRKVTSTEPVARYLAEQISKKLKAGKRVLWLVPGGSAIVVAVQAAALLKDAPIDGLTVSLTDERFGDVGHPDSNWLQLLDHGFVLPKATLHPVLIDKPVAETTKKFDAFLHEQLADSDYSVGLFGIGADGHTAGILPGSLAAAATALACSYQADPFYRITITAPAIRKLDEAVVFARGEEKQKVLDQLEDDVPFLHQPAQLLKQVPSLIVYNDYKGEAL